MAKRERLRDDRDYDRTHLRRDQHGSYLHRDYSAHFFRWSFVRRFVDQKKSVVDVGCGPNRPLSSILFDGQRFYANRYVGVDLNKIKPSGNKRVTLHGEFDFVKRHGELLRGHDRRGFDLACCFEVIEHMHVRLGRRLVRALAACVKPGGTLLLSTPCYDGVHHAANHIHEYTVDELRRLFERAGLTVVRRFGTFMNVARIPRARLPGDGDTATVRAAWKMLHDYFDDEALSCFFAPLFPDHARNNLWVCQT